MRRRQASVRAGTMRSPRADGDANGWSIVRRFLAEFPPAEVWRMPEGMTAFEEELLDRLLADLADTGA